MGKGRKSSFNKDIALNLFKQGFTYREIAVKVGATEDAIRMFLKRHAKMEVDRKNAARATKIKKLFEPNEDPLILEQTGNLTVEERTEIMNSRSFGLNLGEGISNRNFVICNRHAYKTDKKGKLHFDKIYAGSITKNVPPSYKPELLVVS